MAEKMEQELERLGSQGNRVPLAGQEAVVRVHSKGTELVCSRRAHHPSGMRGDPA
jgi:hypothetical protein